MKATITWLGALLLLAAAGSAARADNYYPNGYGPPTTGAWGGSPYYSNPFCQGFAVNPWGGLPPQPFQGIRPPMGGGGGCGRAYGFPTHPYARSPRDFFMVD